MCCWFRRQVKTEGLFGPVKGVNRGGLSHFKKGVGGFFIEHLLGRLIENCAKNRLKDLQRTSTKLGKL